MTERKQGEFEVGVSWPSDTFEAPHLVNHFIFADDGQGVYLAFGHVAPPAQMANGRTVTSVEASPRAALFLSHTNALQLAEVLREYAQDKTNTQGSGQ